MATTNEQIKFYESEDPIAEAKSTGQRINFGRLAEAIETPNLIEVQLNSYRDFLQKDVPQAKRKNEGLQAVFSEVFPIESYDEKIKLEFGDYEIGEPKLSPLECQRESQTYAAPLYVTFRLREDKNVKEERVYMGELPLMAPQGTFIINGAERVVVSQLHRSPGICFESSIHANGKKLFSYRIIPDRGSWLEVMYDTSDLLYVHLDRRKRRRKFLATTFLRALGYSTDEEIIKLFYTISDLKLKADLDDETIGTKVLIAEIRDTANADVVVARAFEPLTQAVIRQVMDLDIKTVKVIDIKDDDTIIKCLKKDPTHDTEEALKDIYRRQPSRTRRRCSSGSSSIRSATTSDASDATRSTRSSRSTLIWTRASSRTRTSSRRRSTSSTCAGTRGAPTTSITSVAAASAPWANFSPTSAARVCPARNVWSRSA
jgi:DNA-directed RNA polymerase subunit beta